MILSIVLLAIIKSKTWGSRYKASLPASSAVMGYWAWQYVKSVEIIAPKSLREKIKETLNVGISEHFNWGLGVRVCEKQGDCQPLPDGSFG